MTSGGKLLPPDEIEVEVLVVEDVEVVVPDDLPEKKITNDLNIFDQNW